MIYIRATVESHSDIADDLLAIHGLSGADAVASLHGIGKATVVKLAKKGCFPLFCIGDVHAEIKSVEAQATKFMCIAYGKVAESCNSMTECRVKMWRSKTGKSGASSVKLCSIPPTTEAFTENVHRCHLQVAIWKGALFEAPPDMDSTKYGWELECRVKMWRSKTGKSGASSVKLCSIPPTTDAFTENVLRCHLQVAIWKAALLEAPPDIDSTKYGWELDHLGILVPRTVPSSTLSAPPDVL